MLESEEAMQMEKIRFFIGVLIKCISGRDFSANDHGYVRYCIRNYGQDLVDMGNNSELIEEAVNRVIVCYGYTNASTWEPSNGKVIQFGQGTGN